MESNKLLIGVQFIDPDNTKENLVFELIVLRDLTLKQLIDGIRYGLLKKGEDPFMRGAEASLRNVSPTGSRTVCIQKLP